MAVQERNRANFADEGFNGTGELKFGLIEVVYEWAKGMVRFRSPAKRHHLGLPRVASADSRNEHAVL